MSRRNPIIQYDLTGKEINRFIQQKMAIDWLRANGHEKASAGTLCNTLQRAGRNSAYGYLWQYDTTIEKQAQPQTRIGRMMSKGVPFAVIQYFESLIGAKTETVKKYELMIIDEKGEPVFRPMTPRNIEHFKRIVSFARIAVDNRHGRVYEFNQ